VEIGSYSTPLLDESENRVDNIDTASDYLNNEKVLPGEEFSFNETLGKRTAEKGYKKAPIIKRTESGSIKGYGIGGEFASFPPHCTMQRKKPAWK